MKTSATLTISYIDKARTPERKFKIDPNAGKMPKLGLCPKCGGMLLKRKHIGAPMIRRKCPSCKTAFIVGVLLKVSVDLGWITVWN